jgi:hypothetical protein
MTIITDPLDSVELGPLEVQSDRAQREAFLGHIEQLERDLQQVLSALAAVNRRMRVTPSPAKPHLLSLAELELVRDGLAAELGRAQDALARQITTRREKRSLLKRMTEAPVKFRWAKVTTIDLGEPGCRSWEVVPKLGPVGMLANWWRIRVSSGCP